jgi:hypothetical protein
MMDVFQQISNKFCLLSMIFAVETMFPGLITFGKHGYREECLSSTFGKHGRQKMASLFTVGKHGQAYETNFVPTFEKHGLKTSLPGLPWALYEQKTTQKIGK